MKGTQDVNTEVSMVKVQEDKEGKKERKKRKRSKRQNKTLTARRKERLRKGMLISVASFKHRGNGFASGIKRILIVKKTIKL